MKLTDLPARYHETIRRQLADQARTARAVPGAPAQSPEPHQRRPREAPRMARPTAGLGFHISLIQCRHRLLDAHDSLPFSVKPLADAITRWLGFTNDSDPALRWEYSQVVTRGEEGILVKIQPIEL